MWGGGDRGARGVAPSDLYVSVSYLMSAAVVSLGMRQ